MSIIVKRDGTEERLYPIKIQNAITAVFEETQNDNYEAIEDLTDEVINFISDEEYIDVEEIQDTIEFFLFKHKYFNELKAFIIYRIEHSVLRKNLNDKQYFLEKYKQSKNTADATIDDNSNVSSKNLAILSHESHKKDNQKNIRYAITKKLQELYPDFDKKQYIRDLERHIIYKHDENSLPYVTQYCAAVPLDEFLYNGIKNLGGLSSAPKNLDSYCGMYINLIFALSAQVLGAVATPGFLVYFDWFARKEWGDNYFEISKKPTKFKIQNDQKIEVTIEKQIEQYFQQVVYSINQPAAARGNQSAFVNFSYFDKFYFESIYSQHVLPDGTYPIWKSVSWLQKKFMKWFNAERLRCVLTFPVESVSLLYKDGEFQDKDWFNFVTEMYGEGHSFFTYISDTVDSLSSCCRLKNKLQKEFMFTNGMISESTGSKSVITLNLNRIVQDFINKYNLLYGSKDFNEMFKGELTVILNRIYKYHNAYNEILWENYESGLSPIVESNFVDLNKLYLTIGINGLNQAAEFLGLTCNDNPEYKAFCNFVFSTIKEQNQLNNTKKCTFNTELVPAESLGIKNFNWDKEDGYKINETNGTNLYASYIFKPNDPTVDILEKIKLHGSEYIGDFLDGGSACHLNLKEHLTQEQYKILLNYAGEVGCQYLTFNIPNSECSECNYITKHPIKQCPKCGSEKIYLYDRIIGYLTKIKNWSSGRQREQKTRIYA